MSKALILLYSLLPFSVFASGTTEPLEPPSEYTVINVENLFSTDGSLISCILKLPYEKPAGVTEVFKPGASYLEGILVERLIVDGFMAKVKGGYHGYDPDDIDIVSTPAEPEYQIFTFNLEYWRGKTPHLRGEYWEFDPETAELSPMLGHKGSKTLVYRPRGAKSLRIPTDAQAAYMTYQIVFPDGTLSESETVYWEFDWPEDFGWD